MSLDQWVRDISDQSEQYISYSINKKTLIKTYGKEKVETTENSIIHELMKKTWEGYE